VKEENEVKWDLVDKKKKREKENKKNGEEE
jgi:hypothetical protein